MVRYHRGSERVDLAAQHGPKHTHSGDAEWCRGGGLGAREDGRASGDGRVGVVGYEVGRHGVAVLDTGGALCGGYVADLVDDGGERRCHKAGREGEAAWE